MAGPVTLRLPPADEAVQRVAAELAVGQPLLELTPGDSDCLELLDGYGRDTGIRFRGAPVGQERGALLDAILAVSRGATTLSPLGRSQARDLRGELLVFTTPA